MKIRGNRIEITQGETFTLDKLVVNQDGSPFIVSDEMLNPHILISISDTEYDTSGKYVKNYWLPIIKKFSETRPVNLLGILNEVGGKPLYPNGFDSITALTTNGFVTEGYMPERGNSLVGLYPSTCVFYVENSDGTKTYRYWNTKLNKWVDYEFSIIKLFPSSDTKNWIPKKYFWNVSVCSPTGAGAIDFNDTVIQLASDGEIFVKSRLKGV